jgi:hypothetical protein
MNRTQYLNEQSAQPVRQTQRKTYRRELSTKKQARSITVFFSAILAKKQKFSKNTQKGFGHIEFDRFGAGLVLGFRLMVLLGAGDAEQWE